MYAFGDLIAFFCIALSASKCARPACVIPMLLCWSFVTFSFIYGNMLAEQKAYTAFRIQTVISDLNSLDIIHSGETDTLQIAGTIGFSPVIENLPPRFRMIRDLVPIMFREKWHPAHNGFFYYYKLGVIVRYSVDLTQMVLPVLVDNLYHTIRGTDGYILVQLK